MLSTTRREIFRALRNQLKISGWRKNGGPLEKSRKNRNRLAAAVVASVAFGSVAVKNSQTVFDEDLSTKPLGSVYQFQGLFMKMHYIYTYKVLDIFNFGIKLKL